MRYERPESIGRSEALDAIASGDSRRSSEAIIRLALNDPNGRWVEGVALDLLESDDPDVRGAAATALGHIARIHGEISIDRVLPALRHLVKDPQTAGRAGEALSDIEIFIPGAKGSL